MNHDILQIHYRLSVEILLAAALKAYAKCMMAAVCVSIDITSHSSGAEMAGYFEGSEVYEGL